MMDNLMKTLIAISIFSIFMCLGFFVGRDYVRNTKVPRVDHTHIHMYYSFDNETTGLPEKKSISTEDIDCLARNIYFEAANQSEIGKLAVGLVVMNRVSSERYPDTICGVVNQRSQFSWVNDGKSDTPKNDRVWKESKKLARDILEGKAEFIDFDDVMHYHADYVSPKWSKKLNQVAQIDQHIFYE